MLTAAQYQAELADAAVIFWLFDKCWQLIAHHHQPLQTRLWETSDTVVSAVDVKGC
jgi:hypothetical protein